MWINEELVAVTAGGETTDAFLKDISGALQNEPNPLLLQLVLQSMDMSDMKLQPAASQSVSMEMLKALQGAWPRFRRDLLAGKTEVIRRIMLGPYALSAGYYDAYYLKAARPLCISLEDQGKACLQLIYDMASTAANAYDTAWRAQTRDAMLLQLITEVLMECESALGAMTGKPQEFIAIALNADAARDAAVLEAVVVKWFDLLKPMGVTEATPLPKPTQ